MVFPEYAGSDFGIIPTGATPAAALPFGYGKIFAKFTATHPTDGSLTFYWGDIGFGPDGVSTSPMVYPVVLNWDKFTKFMSEGGQTRPGTVQLEVAGSGICVPSNGTKRYQVADLLRQMVLADGIVQFYQWNERDNSQTLIWQGFWQGLPQTDYPGGLMVVTIEIGMMQKDLKKPISHIVNPTGYIYAPQESMGQMISKWYGNLITAMDTGAKAQEAAFLGFFGRAVKGVLVAENNDQMQLQYDFHRNDGTKNAAKIDAGIANDPSEPTAIWLYTGNGFCMVDAVNLVLTNNVNQISALFPMEPKVWTPVHPTGVGSMMHPGFTASAYKVTNDDPNDYLQTDDTNYTIGFNVPACEIPGFVCTEAIVMVDIGVDPAVALDVRTIDWGLWNLSHSAHGGVPWYFGQTGAFGRTDIPVGTVRQRYYMQSGSPGVKQYYIPADAGFNLGGSTISEFNQGFLVGRDADGSEVPLQMTVSVTSAGKAGVRVYGISLILHGRITLPRIKRGTGKIRPRISDIDWIQGAWDKAMGRVETQDVADTSRRGGFDVLLTGWGQKDHGTQYNGGTAADAPIERGSGIVNHLLQDRGGFPCNVTSGTPGNFIDALTEEVSGEKFISPIFGPDTWDFQSAIDEIQKHHQVDVHREDDGYHIFYNEMNPHSSRFYQRGGQLVFIEGWDIEDGSFRVSMPRLEDLRNVVQLRYGHSYGSNKPRGSVQYSNPLSVDLYGARDVETFDEPWITAKDLSAVAPEAANFRARFLGRENARRRMTIVCSLSQQFSDLKRGMVVGFGKSLEDYGIQCDAHRCGLTNYAYISDSDTTNYADSAAPKYVKASGDGAAYFMADAQVDELITRVATIAGFTLTGWQYYYGPSVYDGVSWAPFANVVNPNGFKSLGTQRIAWDRPLASSWHKAELPLAGVTKGPGYPFRMVYTAASAQGLGSAQHSYTPRFWGRNFVVTEATRKPGRLGDYAKMDVVLKEVL